MILAILLAGFSFFLVLSNQKVRQDPGLRVSIWILLIARQAISFAQVWFNGLPTVDADPIEFHNSCATDYGRLAREPYGVLLKSLYQVFGPFHILGCELSQVVFALALIVEIELLYFFGLKRRASTLILVFGLLPSCLLNTSVTLREPFQVLAYLLLTLSVVRLTKDGTSPSSLLMGGVSITLLVLFHQGFILLLLLLLPICVVIAGTKRPELLVAAFVVGGCLIFGIGGIVWSRMAQHSRLLIEIDQGKGLSYIDGYQESVARGRSDFGAYLDLSSPGALLETGPLVVFYYLFSPLPWQIGSTVDYYGFGESIVRMILFCGAIHGLKVGSRHIRAEHLLLVGAYIMVELMWAAGTANWGTAFRHRVVGYGLLVILGGIGLFGQDNIVNQKGVQSARQRVRLLRGRTVTEEGQGAGT